MEVYIWSIEFQPNMGYGESSIRTLCLPRTFRFLKVKWKTNEFLIDKTHFLKRLYSM